MTDLKKPACLRRSRCRLCESSDLVGALQLTPTPPANAFVATPDVAQEVYPLDVFFCQSCSHLQLLDVVDPAILFRDYVYVSSTSPVFVKHFEEYAKAVVHTVCLRPGSLVIEIGSNDGLMLKSLKAQGCRVLGIDPAVEIARRATESGIETLPTFFSSALAADLVRERGRADVVIANNVLAHIDDLDDVVRGVGAVLADRGYLVFEVSYLLDVIEGTLFDTIYHEHLAYHSVKPLRTFLKKHDLELVDVQRVKSHGGSIRVFAQKASGDCVVSSSVQDLVDLEESRKLDQLSTFVAFGQHVQDLGRTLRRALVELKDAGKSVAAYGAPAKATTLMYHFGLDGNMIDFIVDDSPYKQGKFSPGLHIPVVPASAIRERRPDFLLVLAWNFADSIIDKSQEYTAGGGHFIVPIPQLRIV